MKEKYIQELPSGYRVHIRLVRLKKKIDVTKNFKFKDYKNKAECLKSAKRFRDNKLYEALNGAYVDEIKTLKEVYEESYVVYPLTLETRRKHNSYFKAILEDLGDVDINTITKADVLVSLNKIRHKSQNVINHTLSIWNRVYNTALLKDYVKSNIASGIIAPKSELVSKPREQRLNYTLEEVISRITETGKKYHCEFDSTLVNYAIIIMYYQGLRPSECFALTKEDINLKNKTISINKAVGSNSEETGIIKTTKNTRSIRTIPISNKLMPYLKELMKFQKNNQLFMDSKGKLLSTRSNYIIERATKGMDFRLYQLRHNFSTTLLKKGSDIRGVMELMGHTDASMTLEYARSNDENKKKIINNME